MPARPPIRKLQLLPPVDVLITRMQAVEAQMRQLEVREATPGVSPRELAGTRAHLAALGRKKHWYLARIRSVRPVETLGVSVSEKIKSKEAHPR